MEICVSFDFVSRCYVSLSESSDARLICCAVMQGLHGDPTFPAWLARHSRCQCGCVEPVLHSTMDFILYFLPFADHSRAGNVFS